MKESAARVEKIPSTMVLNNHIDLVDIIFSTMVGALVNTRLDKWLGVIRIGTYQAVSEDIRWAYEPVSDLWIDIDTVTYSSDDGVSDEGIKY